MKRYFVLLVCLMMVFVPSVEAAIGSKGLLVNGGEVVVLQKGEKRWIPVRDGLSGVPLLKGVTYYSDAPLIFSVDRNTGVVRGNSAGKATLTVVNQSGDCGRITVKVVNGKVSGWWLLVPFPFLLWFLKRGHRR